MELDNSERLMETSNALTALAALSQITRLTIFRRLVAVGPGGMAASKIAEELKVPASSLSFHLKELTHAGLITPRPESRFIIYAANFDQMNGLIAFLSENCCGGNPCSPLGEQSCSTEQSSTNSTVTS